MQDEDVVQPLEVFDVIAFATVGGSSGCIHFPNFSGRSHG